MPDKTELTPICPKCLNTGILRERFTTPPRIRRCDCALAVEKHRRAQDSLAKIIIARAAIVEDSNGHRGIRGKLACPVCEIGDLTYSVSASNGHIWANCSTPGCVQ